MLQTTLSRLGLMCGFGCALSITSHVAAQSRDQAQTQSEASAGVAARGAEAGMYLPTVIAARTDTQGGIARVFGGYDSARRSAQFEALADVTLFGPVALRVGTIYSQRPDSLRPTLGARVQALRQEQYGIDLGVGAFYRPEGFTEAEGELEALVSVARRFGRTSLFANAVYGQDPEANERDGELRLATLYALSSQLQAGLDARLRVDLGSEEGKRRAEGGAKFDLVVGPTASYAFGNIALIAQGGFSLFGVQPVRPGAVALLGLGGAL